MQVQTIDKEDKVDKDQNELIVIDQVHDEVIQLPDKELEFLFIIQLKRFVDSYLSSVKKIMVVAIFAITQKREDLESYGFHYCVGK